MDLIFIFSVEALGSSRTKHVIKKLDGKVKKPVKFHHHFIIFLLKMQEDCSNSISTTHLFYWSCYAKVREGSTAAISPR